MKLNPDCVRAILLTIEEECDLHSRITYTSSSKYERLQKFDYSEVTYHLNQCILSDLIDASSSDCYELFRISDLTPSGHAFLANIRQDTVWHKALKIAAKIGLSSLNTLVQISSNVATDLVSNYFKGKP